MNIETEILWPDDSKPTWLEYPLEFIQLIEAGRTDFTPWYLCNSETAQLYLEHFKSRLGRDLVAFAVRQDREDFACFEKGKGQQILIIHDNTTPGWEDEGSFPTFADWLKDVEAEAEFWREQ